MKNRAIAKLICGERAVDGAGVSLVRVLGHRDTEDFDPFLMMDSFDSSNPDDYTAGFPMHPHRGIETVTYLISGRIDHKDSLGNKGIIGPGECQWMTAGSGILHEEMPIASGRMLGFQLWLNLPQAQKMTEPAYLGITAEDIPLVKTEDAEVRVISGAYGGAQGVSSRYIKASIFDVLLFSENEITLPAPAQETAYVFLIEGSGHINGQTIPEKTAVLLGGGDCLTVSAADRPLRFAYFSAPPLREPIAWGGPIVMNTRTELNRAFAELRAGTFIKHK